MFTIRQSFQQAAEASQIVKDNDDYAGISGQSITGLAVPTDTGYIKYRVHVNSGWLGLNTAATLILMITIMDMLAMTHLLMPLRYIITPLMILLIHQVIIMHSTG